MAVILVYAAIVVVGDIGAIFVAEEVEHYSQSASIMVFFTLFAVIFWLGWLLAVFITERFIQRAPS